MQQDPIFFKTDGDFRFQEDFERLIAEEQAALAEETTVKKLSIEQVCFRKKSL